MELKIEDVLDAMGVPEERRQGFPFGAVLMLATDLLAEAQASGDAEAKADEAPLSPETN